MELAIAGVSQSFEVTFPPDGSDSSPLPVAMSVYDTTSGSPTQVQAPAAMTYVPDTNSYVGRFSPILNHSYLILKAVYEDSSYAAFDDDYAQATETVYAIANPSTPPNPPSVSSIVGIVNSDGQNCNGFGFPVFTVFQGDVKPLPLKAMYARTFNPLPLTDCTEIVVNLLNSDGTVLAIKLSENNVTISGDPKLGMFVANFTSDESTKFAVGELQNIDVSFTINGNVMTIRYYGCFTVFQVT